MTARLALLGIMVWAVTGCARHHAPTAPDVTNLAPAEWHRYVGRSVSMRGTLSLRARTGPFILAGGQPIYLLTGNPHASTRRYEPMADREVRVTGVLHFAPQPKHQPGKLPAGQPADHFYFDADAASVELMPR